MAEAVRSFWKGSLRLSLVFIPVKLVSATRAEGKPQMHQVDRKSKQRIRYQKVIASGEVIDKDDIVAGYQLENGSYVLFDDDELDAVKLKSRHTIELTQFVEHCEIDPLYFERPYYVLPDGDAAEEGYCVIRDALRASGKVAIGQLTIRGREDLIALEPLGRGLALQTLRYEEEIKKEDAVFSGIGDVKVRKDLLDMAQSLIESRSGKFDPSAFENHYAAALRALVKEKVGKGKVVEVGGDDREEAGNVIDFMEALKRSVAQSPGKRSARSGSSRDDKGDARPSKAVSGKSSAKTAHKAAVKSGAAKSSQRAKAPARKRAAR